MTNSNHCFWHTVLIGGCVRSNKTDRGAVCVRSQGLRRAVERGPAATHERASPTVNCSSTAFSSLTENNASRRAWLWAESRLNMPILPRATAHSSLICSRGQRFTLLLPTQYYVAPFGLHVNTYALTVHTCNDKKYLPTYSYILHMDSQVSTMDTKLVLW